MGSVTTNRILVGVVAVLVMASDALGQAAAPRRAIEQRQWWCLQRDQQ